MAASSSDAQGLRTPLIERLEDGSKQTMEDEGQAGEIKEAHTKGTPIVSYM
jgi:hypothetical protein